MFQAERAGEDSRASPAAVFAFTTNSFQGCGKGWGDLPDLNRRLRIHIPLCCLYTKISVDWLSRQASNLRLSR